ncbi:MAG: iron-siderophore ABC transporter substrate-binding protein [Micrococcus sp.]|nr:iron-siderophore ABC transporter substrate-binding protein [Micrococcus sp.]
MSSSPLASSGARALSRRSILGAGGLGLALFLSACSTGPQGSSADTSATPTTSGEATATDAFPVSIEHVYGTTEIPAEPTRVATVAWVNQDVSLALGVVPVGMAAVEFGGNDNRSTDWFDAALAEIDGAEEPAKWSEADGLDFEAIAAVQPDLILAVYSGISQEDYDRLSQIAPTVAYPKDVPAWGTSWQDSVLITGRALGRTAQAESLVNDLQTQIAETASQYPALQGATFLYGTVDPEAAEQISLYTDADNRPKFLKSLGMQQAPVIADNAADDSAFYITWTPERADELVSDVLISWAASDAVAEAIAADPLLSQIPAVANNALVLQVDQQEVLSVSALSPLSIPVALEKIVPPIAEAAAATQG